MSVGRKRAPLLLLAIVSLLAGLWAGLRRLGWDLPEMRPTLLFAHGPLMVCGFLGTLICLERAVALGRAWGIAAPLAAGVGGVLAIAGVGGPLPAWLTLAASVVLLAMFVDFVRKQPAPSMIVMAVAALLWAVGNALWIAGRPLSVVTYWWMGFIVLTILGERYGFSRMMAPSKASRRLFWASNVLVLAGLVVVTAGSTYIGASLLGFGMVLGSYWVAYFDIARRNLKHKGLPRYVAYSVLGGSLWLVFGGCFLLSFGDVPAGPHYDAIVHAVFVGFAFSMIFGHAPLIFPTVLKIPLQYQSFYYAPLLLLHASLAVRIGADLYEWTDGRKWGAMFNVAAILLFFASNAVSAIRSRKGATAAALAVALALGTVGVASSQEDALARSRDLYQTAIAAYNEKDYGAYLGTMREINGLRPNHPRVVYMLAGAYALSGDGEGALVWLNHLADLGLVAEPEQDDDFASMQGTEGFTSAVERFAANARPLGRSSVAFTIDGQEDLIPEGVAHDPLTGNFYVGSVYKRAIVEVRPDEARAFGSWERGDGLWSVFALRVDPARRVLWVCSSAIERTKWVGEDEIGYAGVFKYDLTTRLVIERFVLSNARGKHLFGDMALSRSGDVYVTDSVERSVYRIGGADGVFERWLESDLFASPQGLAFSSDESVLFVADYSYGVFRVDTKSRGVRPLTYPDDLTVLGIDGLAYYEKSLIVIQNGVRPHRVVRMRLNDSMDRVTDWEVLDANHPQFDEPTLGIVVRDPSVGPGAEFYYVANSHWGAFDRDGALRANASLTAPVILKLNLD